MKPRHEPTYDQNDYPNEKFVGYIEEFDMYIDIAHGDELITIVGPRPEDHMNNFDTFRLNGNELEQIPHPDLRITPYHLCLIYAKAIEHGLIKEQEHGLL